MGAEPVMGRCFRNPRTELPFSSSLGHSLADGVTGAELRKAQPCQGLCKQAAEPSGRTLHGAALMLGNNSHKSRHCIPVSGTVTTCHPVTDVTLAGTGPGQQKMQSVPNSAKKRNSIYFEHILLQRKNPKPSNKLKKTMNRNQFEHVILEKYHLLAEDS